MSATTGDPRRRRLSRPGGPGLPGDSPFPPIADYAFLSDCEVSALVAPSGSIEWMCLPRVDGPSVFGAILDRDAGSFRFGASDVRVPAARRYLPGTMVLETSWGTPTGWIVIRDLLLIGPWQDDVDATRYRRAPTDYQAEGILLRMARCVNGEAQLVLDCEPVFDYGRTFGSWSHQGDDFRTGVCSADGVDLQLTLTGDMLLGFEGPRAIARTLVKEGETRFCALSWGHRDLPTTSDEAYRRLVWTAHHWQHWLARGNFPDHAWRSYLERSALTLKGLTYAPTGAIVAAPTTSLPETPGGTRNWDYRYSWIRDATFALWGLYTLGFDWEAEDYFYFLADAANGGHDLQVLYGVGGERVLTERILEGLEGYEGAHPVRVGNAAYNQRQHDVWGVLLDSVYIHTRSRDRLDDRIWTILVRQVEQALDHWREPDRGIWEVRGEPQHFTSSKMMCWVAADRGARLARLRREEELARRWQASADEIKADILAHGLDDRGVFSQAYGTDALDASLLLMPLVRFLPADDERVRRTVLAIADELGEDGFVRRYSVARTDDGLGSPEGAFLICSFWLVSALVEIGELDRARRLCERLLAAGSDLALFGEEIDPETGRHLGNFPQAFTHLSLINAVMHVIDAEAGLSRGLFGAPLDEATTPPLDATTSAPQPEERRNGRVEDPDALAGRDAVRPRG
ncbi:MAG TPA: glycoside hydrolase family 15 protein [Candidatus Limnocylindrales bacterium]|nr:glycoside hydrolase family 15 protein [Candidatus Limnocylindrales bacterium]